MTSFVAAVQDAERAQLIVDLKAARRELVVRRRIRDRFLDATGSVCAIGAVSIATIEGFERLTSISDWCNAQVLSPRFRRAEAQLNQHLPGGDVQIFNDDTMTTDQDVLDLFDKALADLGGLA